MRNLTEGYGSVIERSPISKGVFPRNSTELPSGSARFRPVPASSAVVLCLRIMVTLTEAQGSSLPPDSRGEWKDCLQKSKDVVRWKQSSRHIFHRNGAASLAPSRNPTELAGSGRNRAEPDGSSVEFRGYTPFEIVLRSITLPWSSVTFRELPLSSGQFLTVPQASFKTRYARRGRGRPARPPGSLRPRR